MTSRGGRLGFVSLQVSDRQRATIVVTVVTVVVTMVTAVITTMVVAIITVVV